MSLLRTSADYDTAVNIILHEGAGSVYYAEVLIYSSRFIDDALALIGITHYFDTVLYMRYYKNYKNKGSEHKYRRSSHTIHMTIIHEAQRVHGRLMFWVE